MVFPPVTPEESSTQGFPLISGLARAPPGRGPGFVLGLHNLCPVSGTVRGSAIGSWFPDNLHAVVATLSLPFLI